jgi:hypothetical protein
MDVRAMLSGGKGGRGFRNRKAHRGQILILAVVIIFFFFLVAVALIDVYKVQEARVWGYRVAQQAALYGASGTLGENSNWKLYETPTLGPMEDTPTPRTDDCINPVQIELKKTEARDAAQYMLDLEMQGRGFDPGDYYSEIQVLPDHDGGTIYSWPPAGARLGNSPDWSAENPAVGVYLTFNVATFISSVVGWDSVPVHVFAAAEASQPPVCPD